MQQHPAIPAGSSSGRGIAGETYSSTADQPENLTIQVQRRCEQWHSPFFWSYRIPSAPGELSPAQPSLCSLSVLSVVQKLFTWALSCLSPETALNIGIHSMCFGEGQVQGPPPCCLGPEKFQCAIVLSALSYRHI